MLLLENFDIRQARLAKQSQNRFLKLENLLGKVEQSFKTITVLNELQDTFEKRVKKESDSLRKFRDNLKK